MSIINKSAWDASSLKTSEVEVPGLGGSVRIRELPAAYSAEVASNVNLVMEGREQIAKIDTQRMELLQFAFGVIDDGGNPMFTEQEVEALQQKHGRAFKTVVDAIDQLSGIDKEALDSASARFPSSGASKKRSNVGDGTPVGSS